jgi:hypothetical protein
MPKILAPDYISAQLEGSVNDLELLTMKNFRISGTFALPPCPKK